MGKIFSVIYTLVLCLVAINICSAQWVRQLATQRAVRDIEFINRYTGWACADNIVYKTINGGRDWTEQSTPSTSIIMQIHPVNDSVVYAAGWWNFLKTTDGGENWISIFSGGPGMGLPTLDGVFFINENTGWMCGHVVAMKTTDGGNSFIDSGRIEGSAEDIYFKNEKDGIISAEVGVMFRTTNGGSNWIQQRIIKKGSQYSFIRVSFVNDSVGYIGGEIVFKTTNFGLTWDSVGAVPFGFEQAYCIEFANENTGFCGGTAGTLFKTIDGGHTWFSQNVAQFGTGFFRSIFAYTDSIVWAVGNGKILFTETGGTVSITQINSEIPNGFILHQNYPNPFNPTTTIIYELKNPANVEMKLYDELGREIKTIISRYQSLGSYNVNLKMTDFSGGVYFYDLKIDGETIGIKKLVLLK